MAESESFHLSVVTPESAVLECEATSAIFTAHDGEMGILPHRAPLLARLGIGTLTARSVGETHRFFIDGGFVQMVENRLTILTEQAKRPDELDREAAQAALGEAREMPLGAERLAAERRARVQLGMGA